MRIDSLFVREGHDPFGAVEYETYVCEPMDYKIGKPKYRYEVIVPKAWSKNARDIFVDKYVRKAGVPKHVKIVEEEGVPEWLQRHEAVSASETRGELGAKEVIHRIAGHWTYAGLKAGYFEPDATQLPLPGTKTRGQADKIAQMFRFQNARNFYNDLVYMMLNQMAAPNSPQWFNTGLWWAYGMTGAAQGHHFVDLSPDTKNETRCPDAVGAPIDVARMALAPFTKVAPSTYERPQVHACFILRLDDNMCERGGILDWISREGRIFKYGSGSGANISNLRALNESLAGGGRSSGVMSFARVADVSAGAIKSGGTTRRAAKMLCMDLDHPDIMEFINCKTGSEIAVEQVSAGSEMVNTICSTLMQATKTLMDNKNAMSIEDVLANETILKLIQDAKTHFVSDTMIDNAIRLALQGETKWPGITFNRNFEGNGYDLVPWQNANNSVRIPHNFYDLCDKDDEWWELTARTDGRAIKRLAARALEDAIAKAAWICGDPGMQYDGTINDWNVTPKDGRIRASNPCSEHMRPDGTACNLASLRLMKFMVGGEFNLGMFMHASFLWQIVLDISNTIASLPDYDTAQGCYLYRDTGLGYADLGGVLMTYGLPYDSDEARTLAATISAAMLGSAYRASAMMAEELGYYPRFDVNGKDHIRILRNHAMVAGLEPKADFEGLKIKPNRIDYRILERIIGGDNGQAWKQAIQQQFDKALSLGCQTGFRNAEICLLAPTGTIGILMDCDTTGVEPNLGLLVHKKMVGNTEMMLMPESVTPALLKLGYVQPEIDVITKHIRENHGHLPVQTSENKTEGYRNYVEIRHVPVFQTSLSNDPNNPAISWEAHIKMMAAVQPLLGGAISKTINMQHDVTIAEVKRAYRMGYETGCKSLAIYRDSSKLSQPLTLPKVVKVVNPDSAAMQIAERATEIARQAVIKQEDKKVFRVAPEQLPASARVRLRAIRIPGIDVCVSFGEGHLYVRTSHYEDGTVGEIWALYSGSHGVARDTLDTVCRTANIALQYGVPLEAIVKCWLDTKFEPNGAVHDHPNIKFAKSIVACMAKILAFHELGDDSVVEKKPKKPEPTAPPVEIQSVTNVIERRPVIGSLTPEIVVTGEQIINGGLECPSCGAKTYILSGGTCRKCTTCGHSGSCG